jgi:3-methylcrotonyl-CoA carboxylase alpha subunit
MFTKILIANRGEIACRIIKTAKRLAIKTVAIYSDIDSNARHIRLADEAYHVGGAKANQSYLQIDKIIDIAKKSGAKAIHPGYGFLSENAHFAKACTQNNLVFIGPGIDALTTMGSKQLAKVLLEKTDVPLVPGYHGKEQSGEKLLDEARKIGFPILLKAAAGGGGKGMRSVFSEDGFLEALTSAKREAKSSFADDTMLIEKLIESPRHIEIQIFADNFDNTLYLYERDCSIQRRHQKIIEEAPAFKLSASMREKMGQAAINVARAIDYKGAGTVEFLLDSQGDFYFMEMNTRLQVEHPVTEMITGLDLVEWQLIVAANSKLPLAQDQLPLTGHAIELRIYAEDADKDFLPSTGTIDSLKLPKSSQHTRIDTGVESGDVISMYYDPMIAKLIVWDKTREMAIRQLTSALSQFQLTGVTTNIAFLQQIIASNAFKQGDLSTDFLEKNPLKKSSPQLKHALIGACFYDYQLSLLQIEDALLIDAYNFKLHLDKTQHFHYIIDEKHHEISMFMENTNELIIQIDDASHLVSGYIVDGCMQLFIDEQCMKMNIVSNGNLIDIFYHNSHIQIERYDLSKSYLQQENKEGQLTAPMPGTVVAVLKSPGEKVDIGESLIVIEAMKMEHTIHAPIAGLLSDIFYTVGDQVNEGDELVAIDALEGI